MSQPAVQPAKAHRGRKIALLIFLVVVALIVVKTITQGSDISNRVITVLPVSSSQVRVWTRWHNNGSHTEDATCTVQVTAKNMYGNPVGSGTNLISTGNVKPGQTQVLYFNVVISNNAARFVSSRSDVTLHCG